MGITSTRFIKNTNGTLTEVASIKTSDGSVDANKLVALNDSGRIDTTIINSTVSSLGSASSTQVVALNTLGKVDATMLNTTVVSNGAVDSGRMIMLDNSGRIDSTMLPVGVGADTYIVNTSEVIPAGSWVNIYNQGGIARVRKADATTAGKEAHAFVLSAYGLGVDAKIYFEGTNTGVTGQTPGVVFLSTVAGMGQSTSPAGSGNVVQRLGFCVDPTAVNFQSQPPIVLA